MKKILFKYLLFLIMMICFFIMGCCQDSPSSNNNSLFWGAFIIGGVSGIIYTFKFIIQDK